VFPFIAIGLELQRRGHQVTFMTGGNYETTIRKAGLDFSALFTKEEFGKISENPDLFHPVRGLRVIYRQMCLPFVSCVYEAIAKQSSQGEVGVVASTFSFGARVAGEKLRVPMVTVHLQPTFLRSIYDTPTYPGLPIKHLPSLLKPILYRGMDWFLDDCIAAELNAFRSGLGLARIHRFFANWIHSPDATLGMFPPWFAPPQPDWPAQARLAGFPLFDGMVEHPLSAEVNRFLEDGEPPVIFTAGSHIKQGRWFFEAAMDACERIGCRALLVNLFRDQVPATLPSSLLYAPYVPYGAAFKRSRAVVHHGGIGTVAQAFAAGVPQVIVPIAFDQADNAERMQRLGVGLQISRKHFRGPALADILRRVLQESAFRDKAQEIARRMDGRKAAAAACNVIEETFQRHGR
jgi:UDP:flavonoid glycosyltransferase YjiC (YdhE family)